MNEQLTKLIEQYEREYPGRVAYEGEIDGNCDFYKNFVLWLASRPTCGVEQRKFLDEIVATRKQLMWEDDFAVRVGEESLIWNSDFTANLHKVIKGE